LTLLQDEDDDGDEASSSRDTDSDGSLHETTDSSVTDGSSGSSDSRGDRVDTEGDPTLNLPLIPGLSITKFETMLAILNYSMRFGLTSVALEELLKLVNFLLETEAIPSTLFRFNKVFENKGISNPVEFHFYCQSCLSYLGTKDLSPEINVCNECNTEYNIKTMNGGHFFITIPLVFQLKALLEQTGFF
jgi:hypothetical protein